MYHRSENSASNSDTAHFERLYMHTREKEQRVYTDEEVRSLPDISQTHPNYKEWQVRKNSSEQLVQYLGRKNKALNILEIGCGNGWLSAKMSRIKDAQVTGVDINQTELAQANKVFPKANLSFVYGNIGDGIFPETQFDIVVFAASLPYFPSLEIFNVIFPLLKPGGEIHILDTPLYQPGEVTPARERMKAYYLSLGIPEMGECYYHHSTDAIKKYKHKLLYDPKSLMNRLFIKKQTFPWIMVYGR